jgi:hypothetical protein
MKQFHIFNFVDDIAQMHSVTDEHLIVTLRRADLRACAERAQTIEVYSKTGECYKVVDFKWEPMNIIAQIQLALGRWCERMKEGARLYGTYKLEVAEERISVDQLKEKYCALVRQRFSEARATRAVALLQAVTAFRELDVVIEALGLNWPGADETHDLWFTVPLDPEAEMGIANDEMTLEVTAEGMGYDYDAHWPVNVYSVLNQSVFQLHEGPQQARPITAADLETLIHLLLNNQTESFTAEDFKGCHSLVAILGVVVERSGRAWW